MVSIWLIIAACLLLGLLVIIVAPIKICLNYNYGYGEFRQKTCTPAAEPGFDLTIILLWGLWQPRLRLFTKYLGTGRHPTDLQVGAKVKSGPGGSTVAKEKSDVSLKQLKVLCRHWRLFYRALHPAMVFLKRRTTLHQWSWRTGLGLGEPYYTGLAVGVLWALKTNLTAALYHSLSNQPALPQLRVYPLYQTGFNLQLHLVCIFSLRLSHIIYAGLMTGWLCWKNCRKVWGN